MSEEYTNDLLEKILEKLGNIEHLLEEGNKSNVRFVGMGIDLAKGQDSSVCASCFNTADKCTCEKKGLRY